MIERTLEIRLYADWVNVPIVCRRAGGVKFEREFTLFCDLRPDRVESRRLVILTYERER